jgi:thiosulfate reductase cytochrome b subunit
VGGDVNLKTVIGWLVLAFILWWIIVEPVSAAHVVHNIGTFLTDAAHGIATFFSSL